MKSRITTSVWSLFVLMLIFANVGHVQAEPTANAGPASTSANVFESPLLQTGDGATCWGLDIVLLVDQSTSMYKKDEQAIPNDPEGYRYRAVEDLLNRLIVNRKEECPESVHRISLITFGNYANVRLPLLKVDLKQDQDISTWIAPYLSTIRSSDDDPSQNGTDFFVAFQKAKEVINNASPIVEPEGYGPRRQVVILLTDGNPTTYYGNLIEKTELPMYMRDLMAYLSDSAWQDTKLYFVALHSDRTYLNEMGAKDESVEENWQTILAQHGGKLYNLAYNAQVIPASLNDIVDIEFGHPGKTIYCGTIFYVDPYHERETFTVFHREEDANKTIVFTKLNNETLEPIYQISGAGQQAQEQVIDESKIGDMKLLSDRFKHSSIKTQFEVFLPKPGPWRFDVQGISNPEECKQRFEANQKMLISRVLLLQPKPDGVLPLFDQNPYYDPQQPAPVVIELRTEDGVLVKQDPDYLLTMTASLSLPSSKEILNDGTTIKPFNLFEQTSGHWTNVDFPLLTPEDGAYTLTYSGTTKSGDNKTSQILFNEIASFTVRKLDRFAFNIQTPEEGELLSCNNVVNKQKVGAPIPVKIQLVDAENNPADPGRFISSGSTKAFRASLYSAEGSLIEAIDLVPGSDLGVFEDQFLTGGPEILGCGDVKVTVDFAGEYDASRFAVPVTRHEVNLKRVVSEGFLGKVIAPLAQEQVLLHPDFQSSCAGDAGVQPIGLDLIITNLDGQILDPANIGAIEELYDVKLVAPNGDWETVNLERQEKADGFHLIASGGKAMNQEGEYYFEVKAKNKAFKSKYVSADTEPLKITFLRKDSQTTRPSNCKMVMGASGAAGLLVLLALIFFFIGGPGGSLQFTKPNQESSVILEVKVSSSLLPFRIKGHGLNEVKIDKISFRRTRFMARRNKVHIEITDIDNAVIFSGPIDKDIAYPVTNDCDVIYRNYKVHVRSEYADTSYS